MRGSGGLASWGYSSALRSVPRGMYGCCGISAMRASLARGMLPLPQGGRTEAARCAVQVLPWPVGMPIRLSDAAICSSNQRPEPYFG